MEENNINDNKKKIDALKSWTEKAYFEKAKNQEALYRILIISGFLEDIENMFDLIGYRENQSGIKDNDFFSGSNEEEIKANKEKLKKFNKFAGKSQEEISEILKQDENSATKIFEEISEEIGGKNLQKLILSFCQFRLYRRFGERYSDKSIEFAETLTKNNEIMEPFIIDTDAKNPDLDYRKVSEEESENIDNIAILGATIATMDNRLKLFLREDNLNQTEDSNRKISFLCSGKRPLNKIELETPNVLEVVQKALRYFDFKEENIPQKEEDLKKLTEIHGAMLVAYQHREEIERKGYNLKNSFEFLDSESIMGGEIAKKARANTQDTINAFIKNGNDTSRTLFISNGFNIGSQEAAIKEVLDSHSEITNKNFYIKTIEVDIDSPFNKLSASIAGTLNATYPETKEDMEYRDVNLSFSGGKFSGKLNEITEKNKVNNNEENTKNNNDLSNISPVLDKKRISHPTSLNISNDRNKKIETGSSL